MSEDKEKVTKETEEEQQLCIATTLSGDSCKNVATFPEEKPLYCHVHKHQFSEEDYKRQLEKREVGEEGPEVNETPIGSKKHIFSTKHLTHTLFIDCPEYSPDRGFIRIKFVEGRYETNNDKIAELILKSMKNDRNLNRKITKVQ